LRIRLLPSSAGRDSQLQCLTSFLIDDRLAVDGGSIGFALTPEQMKTIRHIVVTHAHSDHTASLPIFIAEAFTSLESPITIYAIDEVVSVLRDYIFNDHVWPDFEKIPLMNGSGPTIRFHSLTPGEKVDIDGIDVTPIPVNHVVPTVGLVVENQGAAVAFTSDTYCTDEIWRVARGVKNLRAVFVDVSFPNDLAGLAAASKHLTPELLAGELKKLNRKVEVYAVHIKPTNRDEVIREIASLGDSSIAIGEINREYQW